MYGNPQEYIEDFEQRLTTNVMEFKKNGSSDKSSSFWETMDTQLTSSFDLKQEMNEQKLFIMAPLPNQKLASIVHTFDPEEIAKFHADKQ